MSSPATEEVFHNARIVLADEVIEGSILVRNGRIADISNGTSNVGTDLEGDYLLPGLVELHTDHLEGHYLPRPKVRWNIDAALQAHDAQVSASGITTVFDALRVGMDEDAALGSTDMSAMADAILDATRDDRLRAEHFIHLRCEVSAPDVVPAFETMIGNERVRLASLMDHAPGQRQFVDIQTYRTYYQGKMRMTDVVFDAFCARRVAESEANSPGNRRHIAGRCREAGITLASHDDATAAHVEESRELGIALAEFPTTLEAARLSREAGLSVLMGAPNVVRGGSHSGNVSAKDLVEIGVLDVLSSDYVPFSLIQATFVLAGSIGLPAATAMVTRTPARVAGLDDRGEIAVGLRVDLVRVRAQTGAAKPPVVRSVWREGRRVA
ncbi:alpha-D-ribose 1-methylphosphonate 5-triphosphate diphosphatase [Aureimonas sp. Leaf324]|jgi:alpha-D-ribose 1-methylphosphonate 5-triphosphate diphosphatase|uniref:alpha-D-ribose 1-methylphosphonate 5-triphosphate diphosphatase n=1 Tax=Aureimonas sp. Leaf324 TaxID=1736336 RepID=UPI000701EF7A|nr:alpha-D-ribose 1-methylphosphonate 5-triphosphate diphosphatase [Aureimonas sp. Leaf324]KQQ91351.1 phosphonate metabolism protein PhnM [Aureimonas sp. Leaf324]